MVKEKKHSIKSSLKHVIEDPCAGHSKYVTLPCLRLPPAGNLWQDLHVHGAQAQAGIQPVSFRPT